MSDDLTRLRARYEREKLARKHAEQLLEDKSRELFIANKQLKDLATQLEQKVLARTAELKQARDEAIQATNVKSAFLANMSHELRTPLNGVLGVLRLLEETKQDDRSKRLITTAARSGELLLSIINDILDFTKLEAEKLELEQIEFDPIQVLESCVDLFLPQTTGSKITLITAFYPTLAGKVIGDPTRLTQIVVNLLSNAIKFTSEGDIVIKALYAANHMHISISDTGIGMSEQQLGKIFAAFTQADNSTSRKYGGTGLGLSICHRLCKLMGGNIRVTSKQNIGSTFTVTLPFSKVTDAKPIQLTEKLAGKTVLIIENHSLTSNILQQTFEFWQAETVEILDDIDTAITCMEHMEIELLVANAALVDSTTLHSIGHRWPDLRLMVIGSTSELQIDNRYIASINLPLKPTDLYLRVCELFDLTPLQQTNRFSLKDIQFQQQRILLVEDNLINQEVLLELLEVVGLEVMVANNGREAIELLSASEYALVIMDIQMPVLDGITATQQIRSSQQRYADIPIIAMTANTLVGDREKSLAAGMNDHINKPVDPAVLFATLAHYLEHERKPNEHAVHQHKRLGTQVDHNAQSTPDLAPPQPAIVGQNNQSQVTFDTETAIERLGGNQSLYNKVLSMFKQQHECAFSTEYYSTMHNGDHEDCIRLAHTLKGSALNIGAGSLAEAAALLEKYLREFNETQSQNQETDDQLDELITQVDIKLDEVMATIDTLIATTT